MGSENVSIARIWFESFATNTAAGGVEVGMRAVVPNSTIVRTTGCDLVAPPMRRRSVSCGCDLRVGSVGIRSVADDWPGANVSRVRFSRSRR